MRTTRGPERRRDAVPPLTTALRETAPTVSFAVDGYGFVVAASAGAVAILGVPEGDLVGTSLSALLPAADVARLLRPLADGEGRSRAQGLVLTKPDGQSVVLDVEAHDWLGRPQVDSLLLHGWPVDERHEDAQRLRETALYDPLTGLPVRALLLDRLQTALGGLSRGGLPLAVMFVDLRGFKAVNDTGGHDVGDAVLRLVAARMRAALRPSDTVARWGGDEFVVLCEAVGRSTALRVAARLAASVAEPLPPVAALPPLSISVGIAMVSSAVVTADEALRAADDAMYAARRTPSDITADLGVEVDVRELGDGDADADAVPGP